ncbi:MAG: serine O-acetyltransferase [Bacteroidia bacterium]
MEKSFIKIINQDIINHGGNTFMNKVFVMLLNHNFRLLFNHRLRFILKNSPFRFINLYLRRRQNIKYGSDISVNAEFGENVKFAHAFGILIGSAIIENNVIIFQQVTIGSHGIIGVEKAWPTIKEGTIIYAGAKVLGDIVVGRNCTIGANSVINRDLPENAIVVSPSAKIIGYNL